MTNAKVPASYDAVKAIVESRTAAKLVWARSPNGPARRPLLLDTFTASAIVAVHDCLSPQNANTLEIMIASDKGRFVRAANWCLSKAGPRAI